MYCPSCKDWVFFLNNTDIDECALGRYTCDRNAECMDTVGGYRCSCSPGYTGDGRSCSGILFYIFYGHFPQKAKNGLHNYVNFGMSISDIDECSSSNVCHPNAMCNNTVGSYICECSPGYTGDGKSCSGL